MTGRNLCDQCDGEGYTGSEEDNDKKVCDKCNGDGIDWR